MPATSVRKLAKRLVSPDSGLVCPDHWSGPDWVYTDGPAVAELNAAANFAPDPQQELGLDLIFAVGANGLPAAFSFCAICCRQNLKTGLFKQAATGWVFVTDERKVVWSAHEMTTTLDALKELGEMWQDTPALSRRLLPQKNRGIYADNGGERIELYSKSVGTQQILFKARRKTGGRGLAGDKVVLDEAFALEASHVGSLIPTMMARPHGQVLYGSSAGMTGSTVLLDVRNRGRAGSSPRMFYLEWGGAWRDCADPDCSHPKDAEARDMDCALDDEDLMRQNNPTISTGRISIQTVKDMRQELPPSEYMRECMGRWDQDEDGSGRPAIDLRTWSKKAAKGGIADPKALAPRRAAVVLDVEPDRSTASINLAGAEPAGDRVVLMTYVAPGWDWVVPRLIRMRDKGDLEILEVSLHPSGQAGVLIPALKAAGFKLLKDGAKKDPTKPTLVKLTHFDVGRGCATIQHAVLEHRIVHLDQPELADAVAIARTRYVNEAEVWDRRDLEMHIGPVVGVSTALHRWDLATALPDTPPPSPVPVTSRARGGIATAGF